MDLDGLHRLMKTGFGANKAAHEDFRAGLTKLNGRIRWIEKVAYVAIGAGLASGGPAIAKVIAGIVR